MTEITLLKEADLRRCVTLDEAALECVQDCFRALATQAVVMPPILRLDLSESNGEVDVKTAYIPGLESFAIKISPGFFDNPKLGLPSLNGLMVVFSARTGLVEALLLDNGYLTDMRTAAAGAVAARWLSREDACSVGVIGAGAQARLQLQALTLVRPIRRAAVWARNAIRARDYAAEMGKRLKIPVTVADTPAAAARDADIVVTATPSAAPLLHAADLSPGQHVTAMGSDAGHKNELAPDVLGRADLYVCDRLSQARLVGELHHALEAGVFEPHAEFPELGQVLAGQAGGRRDDRQISVCDLTGTGAQDTAIATLAVRRAAEAGLGTGFSS